MDDRLGVSIRTLEGSELALVEREFPALEERKHRDRFLRQQAGEARYLFAWVEAEPVGHLFLRYGGARSELLAAWVHSCPHIEDLLVKPVWRGRGVGSALLEAAEQAAVKRGFARIGLSVSTSNEGARRLYARRGYADCGLGEYPTVGSYRAADGTVRSWSDTSLYLVKKL